jgi:NADPH2:quinone reductase
MLVERPDPVAADGQVVVRNRWIGVNYVDLQHRAGQPYPVRLPLIPGTEAAGTVVAVGTGADPGLVGTPVVHFGHLCGVYAEMTAVPAEFVVPLAADVALGAEVIAVASSTAGPGRWWVRRGTAPSVGRAVRHRRPGRGRRL